MRALPAARRNTIIRVHFSEQLDQSGRWRRMAARSSSMTTWQVGGAAAARWGLPACYCCHCSQAREHLSAAPERCSPGTLVAEWCGLVLESSCRGAGDIVGMSAANEAQLSFTVLQFKNKVVYATCVCGCVWMHHVQCQVRAVHKQLHHRAWLSWNQRRCNGEALLQVTSPRHQQQASLPKSVVLV